MKDPQKQAEELVESWLNGNKTHVLRVLGNMSGMRAACISGLMVDTMQHNLVDRQSILPFLSAMKERLE